MTTQKTDTHSSCEPSTAHHPHLSGRKVPRPIRQVEVQQVLASGVSWVGASMVVPYMPLPPCVPSQIDI